MSDRLFDTPPREPRVARSSWDGRGVVMGEVWAAWCPDCGVKLSDYDHTAAEARQYGRTVLATDHVCK